MKEKKKLAICLFYLVMFVITIVFNLNTEVILEEDKPEEIKEVTVDYEAAVVEFEAEFKEILTELNLDKNKLILEQQQVEQEEEKNNSSLVWEHNYYKLETPLFGAEGRLLPEIKDEIITNFKAVFPVVEVDWEEQAEKRILEVDFGFEVGELLIETHSVQFVQERPEAKMAIVIDDLGYSRQSTSDIFSVDRPLTMAVLPYLSQSVKQAEEAKELGYEIMLHQPFEAHNSELEPEPGMIDTTMDSEQIREKLRGSLEHLPPVAGINNHMGSKGTEDPRVMTEVMKVLKEEGLYFIDSSTSSQSVGVNKAREAGIPTAENYLFIDNVDEQEAVEEMLLMLVDVALKRGKLVTIGHVRTNTANAIKEVIPVLEEKGIKLVYVSQIVK
ncbi:divergent polysaccharide deacetylase family protein [Natroniella sulfidigena]|uniref:divergent polysaccharide deacetylase family protein n=1 Tax=Natroniella sulfidigena TaxID=723921 RepID=UPI00200B598E|nr:divergent polysaccharide deacetylase family protein [Natroniella sulfidigena]MCK8815991.1 divergent polysaccharide deacetylase family protein [Natroniella sulfidigena]